LRKVHTAASLLEVAHLRNLLESEGIACCLRNERLAGGLGEIPFVECWPELWVLRNGDALRARGVIDGLLRDSHAARGPDWHCERCGEWVEAQFAECWRCAGDAPGEAT
jgi:phage terminase large subunit GpA-like protein